LGSLTVIVTDQTGKPVANASVVVDWTDVLGYKFQTDRGYTDSTGTVKDISSWLPTSAPLGADAHISVDQGFNHANGDLTIGALDNGNYTRTLILVTDVGRTLSIWAQDLLWIIAGLVALALALYLLSRYFGPIVSGAKAAGSRIKKFVTRS